LSEEKEVLLQTRWFLTAVAAWLFLLQRGRYYYYYYRRTPKYSQNITDSVIAFTATVLFNIR
jgi:hypothetical protein